LLYVLVNFEKAEKKPLHFMSVHPPEVTSQTVGPILMKFGTVDLH